MAGQTRSKRSSKRSTRRAPKTLSKPARTQVASIAKRVVNSKAETKIVTFFSGPVGQPTPLQNSTGLYADMGLAGQNQFIQTNATDILKVIPDVEQGDPTQPGTADNERDGRFINPVSGQLKIRVMIAPIAPPDGGTGWTKSMNYDLTVVCFLLQSVTFKTYRTLYANNDFTKLMWQGDGNTTFFDGKFQCANLPISKGYYRVLASKKVYLRSSGTTGIQSPANALNLVTNNNSHKLQHEWTWNYGKHLPKKLVYPEATEATANGKNEPLNSAIFWCMGYYNTDGTVSGGESPAINVSQEYTSIMKFKDF